MCNNATEKDRPQRAAFFGEEDFCDARIMRRGITTITQTSIQFLRQFF
jgi:hypothetical protein